jgi:hypothetical protein
VTRLFQGKRLLAFATLVIALASCGGNGSLTVAGALSDPMITDAQSCNGNGAQEVDLTDPMGTVIARDTASFTWQSGKCVIPFSFSDIAQMTGYGLTLPDGNGKTYWVTPQQAANPINLSEISLSA